MAWKQQLRKMEHISIMIITDLLKKLLGSEKMMAFWLEILTETDRLMMEQSYLEIIPFCLMGKKPLISVAFMYSTLRPAMVLVSTYTG